MPPTSTLSRPVRRCRRNRKAMYRQKSLTPLNTDTDQHESRSSSLSVPRTPPVSPLSSESSSSRAPSIVCIAGKQYLLIYTAFSFCSLLHSFQALSNRSARTKRRYFRDRESTPWHASHSRTGMDVDQQLCRARSRPSGFRNKSGF